MAQRMIHVAALDADIPCLSIYKARGLYSSQFRVLLQAAAERLNKNPETLQNGPLAIHVTAFDAVGGSLPPLETLRTKPQSPAEPHAGPLSPIDAILITGSASSAYEDQPWIHAMQSFIRTVHTHYPNIKLFGSCFGHQIIAQALLSNIANPIHSPISTFHVERSPAGFEMGIQPITFQPSFTAHFPPLARATAQHPFRIQLIHGDAVVPTPEAEAAADDAGVSLPEPWSIIGSSAQCAIQGLYNPGRVLTYQGHFELDTFATGELAQEFGRRAGWSAAVVGGYLEQIYRSRVPGFEDDDDSKAAAEALLLFFAGEDVDSMCGTDTGMITPPLN